MSAVGWFSSATGAAGAELTPTPGDEYVANGVTVTPGTPQSVAVAGVGSVPASGASAVVVDIISTTSNAGSIYAYADGAAQPSQATLNVTTTGWSSTMAVVGLGANGNIALATSGDHPPVGRTPLVGGSHANSDR